MSNKEKNKQKTKNKKQKYACVAELTFIAYVTVVIEICIGYIKF